MGRSRHLRAAILRRVVVLHAAIPFLGLAMPAHAQATDDAVVTGTRTGATAASATSIVDRDTIERLQPTTALDVLNDLAGVRAISTGGAAGGSFVSIRGGEPNYALVLIDGVRVNDITNSKGGAFDFGQLDPALIERIDVSRGAGSAIYGSDALSGIVRVTLREPGTSLSAGARGSAGTEGLVAGSLWLGGGWKTGSAIISGGLFDSGDTDGTRLKRQNALGRLRATAGVVELRALGFYARSQRSGFPEDSGGPERAIIRTPETGVGRVWLTAFDAKAALGALRPELQLSYSDQRDRTRSPAIAPGFLGGVPAITAASTLRRFEAIATVRLDHPGVIATIGGALLDERGRSSGTIDFGFPLPVTFALDRTTASGFAEATVRPAKALSFNGALRYDAFSRGNGQWTWRAAGEWRPVVGGPALYARAGTAFKLPSFYALGHPLVGNPALRPERSRDIEGGLRWALGPVTLRMSWFTTRFTDLIDFDPVIFATVNRGRVRTQGEEVDATATFGRLSLAGSVTHITVDSASPLRGRPEWQGSLRIVRSLPANVELNGGARFSGTFFDSSVPTGLVTVPGHVELDLGARWRVAKHLGIDLALRNLTDARARDAVGFPGYGRVARISVSIR